MRANGFGRVALQYWLQLGALGLAFALGRWTWAAWLVLVLHLLALQRIGRWLRDDPRHARGRALVLCVAGQLPGLVLSTYVALSFVGVLGEAFESVVLLQVWTAMWAPLVAMTPRSMLQARALYLWLTLALPFLQLAWILGALRPRAARGRP